MHFVHCQIPKKLQRNEDDPSDKPEFNDNLARYHASHRFDKMNDYISFSTFFSFTFIYCLIEDEKTFRCRCRFTTRFSNFTLDILTEK